MDEEEQQEEQQQEQPIASSAFTNLSINPAPRRPISTFSLFNRQTTYSYNYAKLFIKL